MRESVIFTFFASRLCFLCSILFLYKCVVFSTILTVEWFETCTTFFSYTLTYPFDKGASTSCIVWIFSDYACVFFFLTCFDDKRYYVLTQFVCTYICFAYPHLLLKKAIEKGYTLLVLNAYAITWSKVGFKFRFNSLE